MKEDRTLNRILIGIGIACLLCIILLVASRIQRTEHQDIIAHCDDILYQYGR